MMSRSSDRVVKKQRLSLTNSMFLQNNYMPEFCLSAFIVMNSNYFLVSHCSCY